MKNVLDKIWSKIKGAWRFSIHTWIFWCFVVGLGLEFILESLGRRSFFGGFNFLIGSPLVFLYNASIIFFTLLFALFLRKRIFGIAFISIIWLICGFVNFVVLGYRVTPFAAIDFLMAKDALSMIDIYLKKWQQIALVILIILVIAGIVFLFKRSPRFEGERKVKRTMLACVVVWFAVIGFTKFAVKHNIISDDFANLGMAYKDYGFAYCFTNSIIDNGINEPDDYSRDRMEAIKAQLDAMVVTGSEKHPNVIFIQLESFFDPKTVKGLTLSADPVPNFTRLKEEYPSGYLTVPALGAGTANTEYEVLTALLSSSFGAGEYPYKTTVNKKPVEGLCSVLKGSGYNTFAIHNNRATFYDRHRVYEQMGFDVFIGLEHMYDYELTSTGWAKDYTLVDDIMKCLDSTEGYDLVYTISVQGHGKYPETEDSCEDHIQLDYVEENLIPQFHYYVNQLYEMDEMIANLIDELDRSKEDYVLVLYGDHLPSLDLTDEKLNEGNIFQTEYIIVNNIGLNIEDEDIPACMLGTKVVKALNIPMCYAERANIRYQDTETRESVLNLIAYDMLFGERYLYGGEAPYEPGTIQMGLTPIIISKVKNTDANTVIYGSGFNQSSVVYVNGDETESALVDFNTILLEDISLSKGDEICIKQEDHSHHALSETDVFTVE